MKMAFKSIIAGALCAVGFAAWAADSVTYLDWDDVNHKMTGAVCTVYETYTGQTELAVGTTYVVDADKTVSDVITVNGTVESPTRLILCDGKKLTAEKGVKVAVSGVTTNALVICAQSEGTGVGALEAAGDSNGAGIGGGYNGAGGTITVNGGMVTANGDSNGAGIGGGYKGAGGIVTINGGTVTAQGGHNGAGIGGGSWDAGGTITVNGGVVTANGGYNGAGIGGGMNGAGGIVTVNGGMVTAQGGEDAAGIGGGFNGAGGTVTFGDGFVGGVLADKGAMTQAAYAADHRARFVKMPVAIVNIPQVTGLVYVVLNGTEEVTGTLRDGAYAYAAATGDTLRVYFTLNMGCTYISEPTSNPMKVSVNDWVTTVDGESLPKVSIPEVTYLDWDGTKLIEKSVTDYTFVTDEMSVLEAGETYVVAGEVVRQGSIVVNGMVESPTRLILCDGAKLTVTNAVEGYAAIRVANDGTTTNALVICGQTEGTGVLEATGAISAAGIGSDANGAAGGSITINGGTVTAQSGEFAAGIGGGVTGAGGIVTVNGGTVTAQGNYYGAGIGGGATGAGGIVTINGGMVTAQGGEGGAGIGGGFYGVGGLVTINGGLVTATGGICSAGIGGGAAGAGGTVTINGGTVTAMGGESDTESGGLGGAGIGGGMGGSGGDVTINGGMVTAQGGGDGEDIGCGDEGLDSGTVTISGGLFWKQPEDWWTVVAGHLFVLNTDEDTKDKYPYAVISVRTVTVGLHTHVDVAWTSGDGSVTNEVHGSSFWVLKGTTNVVVIFTAKFGWSLASGNDEECLPLPDNDKDVDISGFVPDVEQSSKEPIEYVDGDGLTKTLTEYEIVDDDVTTLSNGWWVVGDAVYVTGSGLVVDGDVHLVLCDGAKLTVTDVPDESAAIDVSVVEGVTNSLSIYGQKVGTGALTATGGCDGAGIGCYEGAGGTVTINGGMVTAQGGEGGAGIGGGYGGAGGTVTVNGGSVTATGGEEAAGIGGGQSAEDHGTVTFGANVSGCVLTDKGVMTQEEYKEDHSAKSVKMPVAIVNIPQVKGLVYVVSNGTEEVTGTLRDGAYAYAAATGDTLRVYFSLNVGCSYISDPTSNPMEVSVDDWVTTVDGESLPKVSIPEVTYLDWDGTKLIEKSVIDYTFVMAEKSVLEAGETYVVAGEVVRQGRIVVNGTSDAPTYLILRDGAKLTVMNEEKSYAAIRVVADGATTNALVVCGQAAGTGVLDVNNLADYGAAIGGDDVDEDIGDCGIVTINGGVVTVQGGRCSAGIGGGWYGAGGAVTVNGGTVTAQGGIGGAGIGGGMNGAGGIVTVNGGTVTVNGGSVTATGGEEAAGIGGGKGTTEHGTVEFGAGNWIVKAGDAAPGTNTTVEAYMDDHSAKYAHIEPVVVTLKIPAAGAHYTYVVSNETTEIAGELVNGTNNYTVAKGATVKVYFTLDRGYEFDGDVTNPKTIANIEADTVIDAGDLPTAVRTVSYTQVAATEALEFKVDSRTGERVIDGSAAETLAYSAAGWDKGAAGPATIAYVLNGGASETFAENLTGDGDTNWLPKVNGKFAFTHTPDDAEGAMEATFVVSNLKHTLTIAQTNALTCVVSNETGVITGENGVYAINAGDKIWVVFDTTEDYHFTGDAPAPTVYDVFDGNVMIAESDLPETEKYGDLFFGLVRAAQRYPWNGKVDIIFAVTNLRPTVEYALATAFTVKDADFTKTQTNDLPTAWYADGVHTNTVNVADASWFGADSLTNAPSKLSVQLLRE